MKLLKMKKPETQISDVLQNIQDVIMALEDLLSWQRDMAAQDE